jgi:hypothetical protein
MGKIDYFTAEQMYAGINELTRLGLRFEADHDILQVMVLGAWT